MLFTLKMIFGHSLGKNLRIFREAFSDYQKNKPKAHVINKQPQSGPMNYSVNLEISEGYLLVGKMKYHPLYAPCEISGNRLQKNIEVRSHLTACNLV